MGDPENEVTREIRRVLRKAGIFHFKHWGGLYSKTGVSDLIGVKKVKVADLVEKGVEEIGVFVAIEVKGPKGKVTKEQSQFLNNVSDRCKGIGMVAWSADEVIKELNLEEFIHPLFMEGGQNGRNPIEAAQAAKAVGPDHSRDE